MRAYIVGHGSIAQRHIRNLRSIAPGIELIVQQPRSGSSVDLPEDVVFVSTPAEAIDSAVDLAVVASATAGHIESLPTLIRANVPLYVEKPLVANARELGDVEDALRSSSYDAPSVVGCNLRFLPSLRLLHQALIDGTIGRIALARFEAGQWLPDWRPGRDYRQGYSARAEQGGGVVLDLIHELDAARWLLGDFDRIQSDIDQRSSLQIAAEDTAGILLSRHGGPLAVVTLDYISRRPTRRYAIVGEGGTLTWDLASMTLRLDDPSGSRVLTDAPESFDVPATYVEAMQELLSAIENGTETSQPISEGVKTMALAVAVKEANR